MRRLLLPTLVAMLAGLLAPVAQATDEATLMLLPRYGTNPLAGDPLVFNADGRSLVAANGFPVMLWINCLGETACDPKRPARVEVLRDDTWVTFSSGTLLQMQEQPKEFTSKKSALLRYRPVLVANAELAEVIGPEFTVRYRPGVKVRVSGTAFVPASKANDYTPMFRTRGSITVTLTPAAAGRTLVATDPWTAERRVIATAKTDRRGRATVRAGFTGLTRMTLTVLPTSSRAGWTFDITAVPTPPI